MLPVLEDVKLLRKLLASGDVLLSFPETLYNYFRVHRKEKDLITFVMEHEQGAPRPFAAAHSLTPALEQMQDGEVSLLRSDSLLTGIVGVLLMDNVGLRYLTKIIQPCLNYLADKPKPVSFP